MFRSASSEYSYGKIPGGIWHPRRCGCILWLCHKGQPTSQNQNSHLATWCKYYAITVAHFYNVVRVFRKLIMMLLLDPFLIENSQIQQCLLYQIRFAKLNSLAENYYLSFSQDGVSDTRFGMEIYISWMLTDYSHFCSHNVLKEWTVPCSIFSSR